MACSRYLFRYGAGGALSATYNICGDNTPITLTATGGASGAFYTTEGSPGYVVNGGGVIIATTGSVVTYTGFASARVEHQFQDLFIHKQLLLGQHMLQ